MADEHFEEIDLTENVAVIVRGLEDIRAGHVQDAREAMPEIAKETGLKLEH